MREEYNSVFSTPTEADFISHFGRYQYIGKTQILADISARPQIEKLVTQLSKSCGMLFK